MSNKEINAKALCPFFITESPKSITCEGIIGKENVSRFNTVEEKRRTKNTTVQSEITRLAKYARRYSENTEKKKIDSGI